MGCSRAPCVGYLCPLNVYQSGVKRGRNESLRM